MKKGVVIFKNGEFKTNDPELINALSSIERKSHPAATHLTICEECKKVTRHTYAGILSWYCEKCGTISHLKQLPPKKPTRF